MSDEVWLGFFVQNVSGRHYVLRTQSVCRHIQSDPGCNLFVPSRISSKVVRRGNRQAYSSFHCLCLFLNSFKWKNRSRVTFLKLLSEEFMLRTTEKFVNLNNPSLRLKDWKYWLLVWSGGLIEIRQRTDVETWNNIFRFELKFET